MKIKLEPKLLCSVQEPYLLLQKVLFYLLLKLSTVNATYDCKLQMICLLLTMDVE